MGAASRNLAQLAPQRGLLARKVRAGPGHLARLVRELAEEEEVHVNVSGPDMEEDVRGSWPATEPA